MTDSDIDSGGSRLSRQSPWRRLAKVLLPRHLSRRFLVLGLTMGVLASIITAAGLGAILLRRGEIAEAAWIGPIMATTYRTVADLPPDERPAAARRLSLEDAVVFEWLALGWRDELSADRRATVASLAFGEAGSGDRPGLFLAVYGGNPRPKLLTPPYPPADLSARLTYLSAAVARHDLRAELFLRLDDGSALRVTSPRYWRRRTTEVQWGLMLLAGLVLAAVIFVVGALKLGEPLYRLSKTAALENPASSVPTYSPLWSKEVRDLHRALNSERQGREEAIAERTRMLTAISHDLRTPATRLRLRAEFVEDETLREKILADLDLMLNMTRDAIDFLKGGMEREEEERFDAVSLIQSICDDFADVGMPVTFLPIQYPTLRTAGTVFGSRGKSVSFEGLLKGYMTGRPRALKRAFSNLIANAVKYGHQAKVTMTIEPGGLRVEIVDRGPGIPEAEMENVLKPFYRLEKSRNRETGGSGLGLSIAKTVVEAHGGQLEMVNLPTQGLSVRVYLARPLELDSV